MDIFHIGNRTYITRMCRYSKYLLMREIADKVNTVDKLEEILTLTYPYCRNLQTDNESIFTSITCMSLYRRLHITHNRTPTAHSTSNGSVERLHNTLIEIARTLAKQNNTDPVTEIFNAAYEYNRTIHSVTKQKPVEVFFNRKNYPEIKQLIEKNKDKVLEYHNKKRTQKVYEPKQIIYALSKRRTKTEQKYLKYIVIENREDTVLVERGERQHVLHKDNIRNTPIEFNNKHKSIHSEQSKK